MKNINRRSFIKGSVLTAASLSLPVRSYSQVISPSEVINVGCIGIGGRGGDHIKGMTDLQNKNKGVRLVALCDVDQKILDARAASVTKQGGKVETFTDMRRMFDSKNVDAVTIATPNHWHSLAAIWAVQSGKDVYVEKPVCHNVWEGRKMVEAARKYSKMVQAGTQSRSSFAIKEAVAWIKEGNLGKILVARGLCYKPRPSIGKVDGPQPIPQEVNYDIWCGPAPMAPLMRKRLHYDWHWVWPTGNGDLGNQGIHQMDIARWFLGVNELSPRVFSVGGRLGYEDDGETPNTQFLYHDYSAAPLIFEVRGLPEKTDSRNMDKFPAEHGGSVAVIIHCEGGHVLVPNYSSATAYDKDGKEIKRWSGAEDHYENFVKACRSRKHTDLNADILQGYLSSALCHTGNISYRLGYRKSPDEIREKLQSNKNATETFGRMAEHLAANGVDLNATKATLGEFLTMDPKTERFISHREADALLTRYYRRPYVVPEKV
jgi:predicted dehydrogenase